MKPVKLTRLFLQFIILIGVSSCSGYSIKAQRTTMPESPSPLYGAQYNSNLGELH